MHKEFKNVPSSIDSNSFNFLLYSNCHIISIRSKLIIFWIDIFSCLFFRKYSCAQKSNHHTSGFSEVSDSIFITSVTTIYIIQGHILLCFVVLNIPILYFIIQYSLFHQCTLRITNSMQVWLKASQFLRLYLYNLSFVIGY